MTPPKSTRARLVRLSKIILFIGYAIAVLMLYGCGAGNSTPIAVAGNAALAANVEPAEAATGDTIRRELIGFELPGQLKRR